MVNIIVKPIQDIIDMYSELEQGVTISIFVTKKVYSMIPSLLLKIKDVGKEEDGFINRDEINAIYNFSEIFKHCDTLLIGCDAGISRSPAVALGIAYIIKDGKQYGYLEYHYPHYNRDILDAIINRS